MCNKNTDYVMEITTNAVFKPELFYLKYFKSFNYSTTIYNGTNKGNIDIQCAGLNLI
jgi:hypothetical protein